MSEVKTLRSRRLAASIVVSLLGLLLVAVGVFNIAHTLVIVSAIIGLIFLATGNQARVPEPWPPAPVNFRSGARNEVARLAWATVDRDGHVSEKALQRVRTVAQKTLALKGVTWTGEAGTAMAPSDLAMQLLGNEAVTTLTTKRKVRPRALEDAVIRLEKIGSAR